MRRPGSALPVGQPDRLGTAPPPGPRRTLRSATGRPAATSAALAAILVATLLVVGLDRGPGAQPPTERTVAISPSAAAATATRPEATRPAITPPASSIDPGTMPLLLHQLNVARQVALRHPTLAAALADGYTQAAPYAPGIGSHYMKYSLIYRPFDVSAPSMLLFNGDAPTSKIVGLAYYVYDSQGPPDGFAGPFDHWHQHQQVCVGPTGAHLSGEQDAIECGHRGRNAWMLHLWVIAGPQTPQAVFSDNCTILT